MDKYLFRGKRKDNSEWVYGSLIKSTDGDYITAVNETWYVGLADKDDKMQLHRICLYEVFPETVGLWSGEYSDSVIEFESKENNFTQKNEKIFYGDILCEHCCGKITFWVVDFVTGRYILWNNEKEIDLYDYVESREPGILFHAGNIHDNPELMAENE